MTAQATAESTSTRKATTAITLTINSSSSAFASTVDTDHAKTSPMFTFLYVLIGLAIVSVVMGCFVLCIALKWKRREMQIDSLSQEPEFSDE